MTNDNTTETKVTHPFEKAGLGLAPFRYVGVVNQEIKYGERVIGSVGGCEITTTPGGTCAYCGHYILNMFNVESADGKTFHVGCDCIEKVGDVKLTTAVSKDVKEAKKARDKARVARAIANLSSAHSLSSQPHPTPWRAAEGETMMHWCRWMFANAGMNGKLKTARVVELAIANRVEE